MSRPGFNAFEVLDITHENYYSRVLAWLLNPTESHQQGNFLLKWLMKKCEIPQNTKFERISLEETIKNDEMKRTSGYRSTM